MASGIAGLTVQGRAMSLVAGNICDLAVCTRSDVVHQSSKSRVAAAEAEFSAGCSKRRRGRVCTRHRLLCNSVVSEELVKIRSFSAQNCSQTGLQTVRHSEGSSATASKSAKWDQGAGVTASKGTAAMDSEPEPSASALPSLSSLTIESSHLDRKINILAVGVGAGLVFGKLLALESGCWDNINLSSLSLLNSLQLAAAHNWSAYEAVLAENPVLTKMITSGIVYSLGDWSAQTLEGRGLFDFNRMRILRSGLVGFCLHGSLSHYYYHFCEWLFPWDTLWVVPIKVAFDQTLWSLLWNSIYFVLLAVLRGEKPDRIWAELEATSIPLLQAGWKLWPLAHIITYGVIPVEQRVLWVDTVELVWVTILSTFSNNASPSESPTPKKQEPALGVSGDVALLPAAVPILVNEQKEEKGKVLGS